MMTITGKKIYQYKDRLKRNGQFKTEEARKEFHHHLFLSQHGNKTVYYHAPECDSAEYYFINNDIYPLQKIQFEDASLFAPHDLDAYLKKTYENYMEFPKTGLLHHKGLQGSAKKKADVYGTIIEKVKKDVEEVNSEN